jgi:hypothetical protein
MLSRPTLHSVPKPLVAAASCLAVLAVVQRVQDNDSSAATPGLTATFSGKAFAPGPDSQAPVMKVSSLGQGEATSGTVTVANPGPGTRYFWLSPGRVSERLGAGGGRLSTAVAVTIMDVSDIAAPSVIYRGPLRYVGARPLGFLGRGERRSFSFLAERPAGGRSPVARTLDPYRGAAADIGWTWHSLAGRPDAPAPSRTPKPPRPQADRHAPDIEFSVPRRQRLLERRALALTVRCSEDCMIRPSATMASGGHRWRLAARRTGPGFQGRHAVIMRFSGTEAAALRGAMVGGRTTGVRLAVVAYDRSGNRRSDSHAISLRPRR